MDQIKIGQFIKATRKEKNLTQREVAERLGISEKTVSKWETGNGLPEVSFMLPLCKLLEISANELLSGERLDEKQYFEKAEQNIMDLLREKAEAKKKVILGVVVVLSTLLPAIVLVLLSGLIAMETWLRIVLIVVALLVIFTGIAVACVLDRDAGVYECKYCGAQFVPTMGAYIWGPHTLTKRRLKCPKCGKKSFCKKRLGKSE